MHGYWLLARLLRRYPDLCAAPQIAALFDERITTANVAAECAYLDRPESRGFERPYGWGWLLALQAELDRHADGAGARAARRCARWPKRSPSASRRSCRSATIPIRTGVHSSTAFALRLAADYAEPNDPDLFALMRDKALAWYGGDRDAQAWEPSQDDFLSPALMEAECMRRFLAPAAFRAWFAAFLPRAADGEPATLFAPARVSDRSDGKIAHLDGLNFSRAWCWRAIAAALGDADPVTPRAPRRRRRAHRRQPPPRRRRLHGRALARDVRAAGVGGVGVALLRERPFRAHPRTEARVAQLCQGTRGSSRTIGDGAT